MAASHVATLPSTETVGNRSSPSHFSRVLSIWNLVLECVLDGAVQSSLSSLIPLTNCWEINKKSSQSSMSSLSSLIPFHMFGLVQEINKWNHFTIEFGVIFPWKYDTFSQTNIVMETMTIGKLWKDIRNLAQPREKRCIFSDPGIQVLAQCSGSKFGERHKNRIVLWGILIYQYVAVFWFWCLDS